MTSEPATGAAATPAKEDATCPAPCGQVSCGVFGCLREWQRVVDGLAGMRRCRGCGCTEYSPCVVDGAPCRWVGPDLCSACRDAGEALPAAESDILGGGLGQMMIEAAWHRYAGWALATESPLLQSPECRRAFFAGAVAAARGFDGDPGGADFLQEAWTGGARIGNENDAAPAEAAPETRQNG